MNNYYTYMYCREDGTPYYIGKGKGYRIHSTHNHISGLPPVERRKYLKTNLTEEESFRHEMYMIHVLGRKDNGTGILRNLTDGGNGGTSGRIHSEETKEKMRNKRLGVTRVVSDKEKTLKKSYKWWNNGVDEKMSDTQPEGFVRGRLQSILNKLPNHKLNLTDEEKVRRKRISSRNSSRRKRGSIREYNILNKNL